MKIFRAVLVVAAIGLVGALAASCAPAPNTGSSVDQAIRAHFGDQEAKARQVVACESGFNPNAYNAGGGWYGLFQISRQYHEGTFNSMGYNWDRDIWNPWANAQLARSIYNQAGGWGPWGCA